jgi:hypothetical protein
MEVRAACAAAIRAAQQVPGVLVTPSADAQAVVDAAGTTRVRVYYWSSSHSDPVRLSTQVLAAVQDQRRVAAQAA